MNNTRFLCVCVGKYEAWRGKKCPNKSQTKLYFIQVQWLSSPLRNRTRHHLHIGDNGFQRTHGKVGASGLYTENPGKGLSNTVWILTKEISHRCLSEGKLTSDYQLFLSAVSGHHVRPWCLGREAVDATSEIQTNHPSQENCQPGRRRK